MRNLSVAPICGPPNFDFRTPRPQRGLSVSRKEFAQDLLESLFPLLTLDAISGYDDVPHGGFSLGRHIEIKEFRQPTGRFERFPHEIFKDHVTDGNIWMVLHESGDGVLIECPDAQRLGEIEPFSSLGVVHKGSGRLGRIAMD